MKRIAVALAIVAVIASFSTTSSAQRKQGRARKYPIGGSYPSGAKLKVARDLDQRLARFKPVTMPFNEKALSAKEGRLVRKLVEAARYLDYIFWRQNDPEALTLYQQLVGGKDPRDRKLQRMLFINASRFDFIDGNKPFVGTSPMPPGRGLYPHGVTREQIEKYVQEHPEKKAEIYSSYTVLRRNGDNLEGLRYHIAYRAFLQPAAKALREAAALSEDKAFAEFLHKRADALLTDDYFPSDLLWLDLQNPKFDIIFAPYESYIDEVLGTKTSYGAAVLIRNEAESKKLAVFQKYVPEIQESLPLAAEDKPSKRGQTSPMEVMDVPYWSGDFLHGYQAVADNLPNDPRIHQQKGTKKIFFRNFMDARVNDIIMPLARRLMRPDQAARASADGYLTIVMMHEISHGIGPVFSRTPAGKQEIREAVGPVYSALEEAKADVVGMVGTRWLVDHGYLPQTRMEEYYASYVAGIFRTVRFGTAEAHGHAEMMEFNYLLEQGAIRLEPASTPARAGSKGKRTAAPARYVIDFTRMPTALASLAKELLETEATGDRERAERWFAKYDKMPAELRTALQAVRDVPVDMYPVFSFPEIVQ
ncbi:MAG TPA: Zn-dependent hydrolase [Clostridia bacterium]|nr:Zn-dependent hydrolase [Clostridia bacterium]